MDCKVLTPSQIDFFIYMNYNDDCSPGLFTQHEFQCRFQRFESFLYQAGKFILMPCFGNVNIDRLCGNAIERWAQYQWKRAEPSTPVLCDLIRPKRSTYGLLLRPTIHHRKSLQLVYITVNSFLRYYFIHINANHLIICQQYISVFRQFLSTLSTAKRTKRFRQQFFLHHG